jgi:urea transport system substrate-binding protein
MMNRRRFLKASAATALLSAGAGPKAVADTDGIKIGTIFDLSGGLEIYGKPPADAAVLALEDINAAGGLLGRKVEAVAFDSQSNMQLYTQYAQELAVKHKVAVAHAGITSASR